ncbi:hypothetical protein SKAU_G00241030 [Synaphobranchus kaupii]|uniref:Uncharacterized protein n=1 Tax=Synaphobranchus kaupii TaxID=118154 RepID=A0A9Q1F7F8_SYNKA|nr:hypothetical protein SKAU_G00241030 [Synaphobranchus kaupii]
MKEPQIWARSEKSEIGEWDDSQDAMEFEYEHKDDGKGHNDTSRVSLRNVSEMRGVEDNGGETEEEARLSDSEIEVLVEELQKRKEAILFGGLSSDISNKCRCSCKRVSSVLCTLDEIKKRSDFKRLSPPDQRGRGTRPCPRHRGGSCHRRRGRRRCPRAGGII